MKILIPVTAFAAAGVLLFAATVQDRGVNGGERQPVIVELFTSEGCSSCPPADALLEKLDQAQPVPGAFVIAMSEHVDYWNYIGWKDPWSSPIYSRRQEGYAGRFRLQSIYTPEAVVNGAEEAVGTDAGGLRRAIQNALRQNAEEVRISEVGEDGGAPFVEVQVTPRSSAARGRDASVMIATAENATVSHVLRGENGGRTLRHAAVVLSLSDAGRLGADGSFRKRIPLPRDAAMWKGRRFIAFVQDADFGPIRGAAMRML